MSQQQLSEIQGPWQAITRVEPTTTATCPSLFWAEYWDPQRPVLIRNAFPAHYLQTDVVPTWDEILSLACYNNHDDDDDGDEEVYVESAESARWIRHRTGDPTSFDVELGPFEREDILKRMQTARTNKQSHENENETWKWTLLVNDVDRYHLPLAQWMDSEFAFLPRWRRDDAQISLAGNDGGIGPHVDNYDVCLVQVQGQRQWIVGQTTLSVLEERQLLIPDIPVSIVRLQDTDGSSSTIPCYAPVIVYPGDVLYVPPRFVHCGTALSKDCMTLSVGCRAPSAAELVARVAERIQDSTMPSAVCRYTDDNIHNNNNNNHGPSLTMAMKDKMKQLVRSAVDDLFNNDAEWDALVGRLTTEAIRYSENAMIPLLEESDSYQQLWGKSGKEVLERILRLENKAELIRTPGISIAYSQVPTTINPSDKMAYRLFVHGEMWEVDPIHSETAAILFRCMERGTALDGTILSSLTPSLSPLLEELIEQGILRAHSR
jgi:50S ribosomal protein L16 3-hydroxylase